MSNLLPLHAGTYNGTTIVLDPTVIEGVTVYPYGWLPPWIPSWFLLQRKDDGVYLAGEYGHGMYRHPILVVPEPARDGMAWDADPGGGVSVRHCSVVFKLGYYYASCKDDYLGLIEWALRPGGEA